MNQNLQNLIKQHKIKAVLFDLDGVLVEARDWHYEALNQALGVVGHTITREEHESYYNGLPTRHKLQKLSREKDLPGELHDFIYELKQRYTFDYIHTDCEPDDKKQIMLDALREHGLKLAVCTNAIRPSLSLMLQKSGIDQYFDLTLSNQDVKRHKPDPEIYLTAIKHFGVEPEECIVVEDAPHGIEAGKKSGAHVIEVAGVEDVNIDLFENYLSNL